MTRRRRSGRTFAEKLQRLILGRPLKVAAARSQKLGRPSALAILSSDALSSVAYAIDAMMRVLLPAGAVAFVFVPRLSVAIIVLLLTLVFSYRQTVKAYPS